jgi:tetratricopeptide (TPR) repeat protein
LIQFFLGREYLFLIDREVVLEFVREEFERKAEQSLTNSMEINTQYPRAYIGLSTLYAKRTHRIVNESSNDVSVPPEALQFTQDAIDLYSQAYDLSESSTEFGIPLHHVAKLALGNIYILKGQILYYQGEKIEALQQFDIAITNLEQTIDPFISAKQARYLTQAYEYLGSAFEWKGYINILSGDNNVGKQNYERSLNYLHRCIGQADSTYDLIIKNEIVSKICHPGWERVKNYLGSFEGTGERSE